jgi:hypothetical protein
LKLQRTLHLHPSRAGSNEIATLSMLRSGVTFRIIWVLPHIW